MRAIVVDEFGGPEQLRAAEVATPVPGPGEVLVEIYAAPVNYVTCWSSAARTSSCRSGRLSRVRGQPALSVRAGVALRRYE
jgi:NADPH:quinone reductase-like Zn-dependent oxidoreductase